MSRKQQFNPSDLLPKSYTPRSSRSPSAAPHATSPRSPSSDSAQRSVPDRQRSSPDRQRSAASSSRGVQQSQPKFHRSRTNSVDHPVAELQRMPAIPPQQFAKESQRFVKHYLPLVKRGIDIEPLVRANARAAADAAGLQRPSREVPPLIIPPSAIPEYQGVLTPEELDAASCAPPPQPPKPSPQIQPKPTKPTRAEPSAQRTRNPTSSTPSPSVMHPRASPALSREHVRQAKRGPQPSQLQKSTVQPPMPRSDTQAALMAAHSCFPDPLDQRPLSRAHAAVLSAAAAQRRAVAEGAIAPPWMPRAKRPTQVSRGASSAAHPSASRGAGSSSASASPRRSYSSSSRAQLTPARSSSSTASSSLTSSSAKWSKKPTRHQYPP